MGYEEFRYDETIRSSDLPLCPIETVAWLIGGKWKMLIIRDLLANKTLRFGALKNSLSGISQKVLTSNLREMEAMGLIVRRVYAEVPPKVEYSLTETGESLRPVFDAMRTWSNDYKASRKLQ